MTGPFMDVIAAGRAVVEREAAALADLVPSIDTSFGEVVDLVERLRGRVVTSGLGKSGVVATKIASTLCCTGSPALFLHAGEAMHGDAGALTPDDLLLACSFSGETVEVCTLAGIALQRRVPVVALTGRTGSTLARMANVVLAVPVTEEADPLGIVPTSSSAVATAVGDALAVVLMQRRGATHSDVAVNHPGGELGRRSRASGV